MRTFSQWILVVGALVVIFWALRDQTSGKTQLGALSLDHVSEPVVPQLHVEREFLGSGTVELVNEFGAGPEGTLLRPYIATGDGHGRVFVLDFGDMRLKAFLDDGTSLFSVGGIGDGMLLATFGRLFEFDSGPHYVVTDGNIASARGSVVFAPRYYPFISRFDSVGNVVYVRSTVKLGRAVPSVETGDISGTGTFSARIVQKENRMNGWISVSDDRVFVHALDADGDESVIDVYDFEGGDYQHSVRLPIRAGMVKVVPPFAYGSTLTTVAVFRLPG